MSNITKKETRKLLGNSKTQQVINIPKELNSILEKCEMDGEVRYQDNSDSLVISYEFVKTKPE